MQDTSRVLLKGRGLTSAKCGEEVSFTIDGSQAGNGTPKVQLFSPTSELNVMLQHLGKKKKRQMKLQIEMKETILNILYIK